MKRAILEGALWGALPVLLLFAAAAAAIGDVAGVPLAGMGAWFTARWIRALRTRPAGRHRGATWLHEHGHAEWHPRPDDRPEEPFRIVPPRPGVGGQVEPDRAVHPRARPAGG